MTTSTSVERRRRVARLALSLSTILCSGLAAPALAQMTAPAPVRQSVDANGVDLFAGAMNVASSGVSMGQDTQGLRYYFVNQGAGWSDNITAVLNQNGNTVTVSIGAATDDFTVSGSTFTSNQGRGATLTLSGGVYTYVSPDGTVANFAASMASTAPYYANLGRVTDITQPSGTKLVYDYQSVEYCSRSKEGGDGQICTGHAYAFRLKTVTSSYGYQIALSYASDDTGEEDDPDSDEGLNLGPWSTVLGTVLTNLENASSPSLSLTTSSGNGTFSVNDSASGPTVYRMNGGAVAGITKPGSASEDVTIGYANGRVSSVATPAGTWSYAASDANGARTVTVTDPGAHATTYVFDIASSLPTSVTDALGRTMSWTYTPDNTGHVQTATASESGSVDYAYDGRGNVTSATRHAKPGSGLADIVTSAVYPAFCDNALTCNQPTSTTDADGNETDYAYDPSHGGVVRVTLPAGYSDIHPQMRYGYTQFADQFGGMVWRQTSSSACTTNAGVAIDAPLSGAGSHATCEGTSDEAVTSTDYGSLAANNLLPVSMSKGAGDGSLTATASMIYDAIGNLLTSTDPLGNVTGYTYDGYRRLVEIVSPDPDGSGPLKNRAKVTTYTPHGLVASVAIGTSNATGSGFTAQQQLNTSYDAADRKIADSITAGGATYGVTQYSYDAAGRLDCTVTRMNSASFGSLPDACTATSPGADGPDRITRVTGYDALNRATQVTSAYGTAAAAAESVSYTPDGQTASTTDANGNVTAFAYDGFDRPLTTTYPSPTTPGRSNPADYEQLGYDASGNVTSHRLRDGTSLAPSYDALNRLVEDGASHIYNYDLLGRLTSATGANDTVNFGYDALGRKTSQGSTYGGNRTMTYDLAGRRTGLTWADGFYVTYDYDALGEMLDIKENGGAQLAGFTYDDLGRRVSLARANGTSTTYAYDAASRLTGLTLGIPSAPNTIGFGYNAAGQITSRTGSNDAYAWTGAVNASRSYAVNGLNQYTQAGGVTPTYDARGNTTSASGTSYGYDQLNQLTTFSGGAVNRDALGAWLDVSTEQQRMVYDDDRTIEEYGYDGTVKRRYVYGPGQDEPLVWYEGAGTGDRRFLHADERGSIVAVTDNSGAKLAINRYDEHGAPATGNLGRFQYTGQRWVPALGLYDYKVRMYSPSLGRFMQTDPIGYGDGLNWYSYAGGDPVNGSDPSGTQDIPDNAIVFGNSGGGWDSFGWDFGPSSGYYVPDIGAIGGGGSGSFSVSFAKTVIVTGKRHSPAVNFGLSQLGLTPVIPLADLIPPQNEVTVTGRPPQNPTHHYSIFRRITRPNTACSAAQVSAAINRNFVPGSYGTHVNGQSYTVTAAFGLFSPGSITFRSNSAGTVFSNVTNDDHMLRYGSVTATIGGDQASGYSVSVVGDGNNTSGFIADLNQLLGPGIFEGQLDGAARDLMGQCHD